MDSLTETVSDRAFRSVDNENEVATVLLVEDTEDNRQMMKRLLEMSGFRVVEAINGREAVRLAAEVGPDIILMDLSLPGALQISEATASGGQHRFRQPMHA